MKLDTTQARQLMAIHYLPGLRFAIDELGALIRQLEGTSTAVQEPSKQEGEVVLIRPTKTKRRPTHRPHPHYSDTQKKKLVKQTVEMGIVKASQQTGVSMSALTRWRKEFGGGENG